jgi:hypothetical protein
LRLSHYWISELEYKVDPKRLPSPRNFSKIISEVRNAHFFKHPF